MDKNIVWACVIKNCAAIFAWATLAVVFDKWWIALFTLLFMNEFKKDYKRINNAMIDKNSNIKYE